MNWPMNWAPPPAMSLNPFGLFLPYSQTPAGYPMSSPKTSLYPAVIQMAVH